MKKLLIIAISFIVLSIPFILNTQTSASSGYCSNVSCSGGSGTGPTFANGVGCIAHLSAPNCNKCINGTITRVDCNQVTTNCINCTSYGDTYCQGRCEDSSVSAYYANGHTCRLAGQSGTWKCQSGTFVLIAADPTPSPNPTQAPTAVPTATPSPTAAPLSITGLRMPERLTQLGSKTTDFSKITDRTQASVFSGLTFDDVTKSSIKFEGKLDLTNEELVAKLKDIDQFIELETALVGVNTDDAPELKNIPATITMYGLELDPNNIEILKDGEPVTEGMVFGIEYDKETNTLTFGVTGFSNYSVKMDESEPEIGVSNGMNFVPILLLIVLFVITLALGVLYYKHKHFKHTGKI